MPGVSAIEVYNSYNDSCTIFKIGVLQLRYEFTVKTDTQLPAKILFQKDLF